MIAPDPEANPPSGDATVHFDRFDAVGLQIGGVADASAAPSSCLAKMATGGSLEDTLASLALPIVGDGVAYVENTDDGLVAVDLADGTVLWSPAKVGVRASRQARAQLD